MRLEASDIAQKKALLWTPDTRLWCGGSCCCCCVWSCTITGVVVREKEEVSSGVNTGEDTLVCVVMYEEEGEEG